MTQLEQIKEEVAVLNERLEKIIQKHYFTLSKETEHIYKRLDELQSECTHDFDDDGVCVYCGKFIENYMYDKVREEVDDDNVIHNALS